MSMRSVFCGAVCAVVLFGSVEVAEAGVYSVDFVASSSDPNFSEYGPLTITSWVTTATSTLPDLITGIVGTVSGALSPSLNGTITGVSGYAASDNLLLATGTSNQFTLGGLSFTVGNSGQAYNLYTYGPGEYALSSSIDSTGYPTNGVSGALTVTAVPEASTWAMMLFGFAGLAFSGYRRTKSRRSAEIAAV